MYGCKGETDNYGNVIIEIARHPIAHISFFNDLLPLGWRDSGEHQCRDVPVRSSRGLEDDASMLIKRLPCLL